MLDRLLKRGAALAGSRRRAIIERLLGLPAPRGVSVAECEEGIVLSGRRLRRRLIDDVALRSFGR